MVAQKTVGRRAAARLAGVLGIAGAGAALLTARPERAHAVAGSGAEIVGTWTIESPGPSNRLLQTYHADGTHLSVHDEHPTRTPQLGSWTRVDERTFLMRNISLRFDAAGAWTGSIDVRALYTVSPAGDTMSGRGVRLELDQNGNLLQPPINWTSQAVRVVPVAVD